MINCAAYTAVDKAETDVDMARKVNAIAVQNLVQVAQRHTIKLIHVSTDYVFNGNNYQPLQEEDAVSPLGGYGETKREGENYVLESDIDGTVIRTSWLYSSHGNNFVKTMMRLGKECKELGVMFDQIGTPPPMHVTWQKPFYSWFIQESHYATSSTIFPTKGWLPGTTLPRPSWRLQRLIVS